MKLTIIREAQETDFPAIYELINLENTANPDRDLMEEIFFKNLKNDDSIYLVSTVKNEVVGFVSCVLQQSLSYGGQVAEIQELSVIDSDNAKNIYKKLVVSLQNFLKDKKVKHVEFKVQDDKLLTDVFGELVYDDRVCRWRKQIV